MGGVTVTIRNPAEPHKTWKGLFLVDTGATDCLVPRPHLESIGLIPKGQRVYELADGSEIRMDITLQPLYPTSFRRGSHGEGLPFLPLIDSFRGYMSVAILLDKNDT